MPSDIHNLDTGAILLMFLAGELTPEDHAEVEQMLKTDQVFRRQHDELAAMMDSTGATLASLDAKVAMPSPMGSSVRNVSRSMAQWNADRLAAARPQVQTLPPRRFGWMATVAAVAACILIGVFVMWSRVDDFKKPVASNDPEILDPHAGDITLTPDQKQDQIAQSSEAFTPVVATDNDQQLSTAERDMNALAMFSDSITTVGQEDSGTP